MLILLFFLLGACISVLSGFFGVGGGFILTPLLMLFGYSPIEAVTTSLLFTLGTSFSGITTHIKLKNILWKNGIILGISGIASTQLARPFVMFLENRGLDEWVIPIFYIILLSYFAMKMFKQGKKSAENENKQPISPSIIKMIFIGAFAGFVSTTLGVGGGFIIVPLSVAFLGFEPKKAIGTSLFTIFLIVPVAFLSYAFTVSINYKVSLLLVAGGLIGSSFGAKLTRYYENKEISLLLSGIYIATLTSVILKLVNLSIVGLVLLGCFILYFFVHSILKVQRYKANLKGSA
ncbi:sulfite exporter TauE/SafE family protein [Bacillus sp. S/N-304-OC-R1]|uniref:sulfite exporter TauE/SafE family protein n=1 Tax=Bacillus sp. S/N-304-OC-R1 TaxID=2758034 RepID=UPI001C8E7CF8|nr:sulfite exporter TauE/SafE family protein [Bacillus sp. S/N-304-OC-R1]MBY0121199.1 sulfite exporter TauE/SafE family protein [Bacillus sp. S/N-304-OC-R1]